MLVEFWGLPTLASIISDISSSISKNFVLILLQISWIFQSIPNCLHFDDSEGRYGQKSENQEIRKFANLSQPWNLAFFQGQIFQLFFHPYAQRVPKWKIAHIWQSKEPKNTKKTPYNVSVICFQSLTDVLQHPVFLFYCFIYYRKQQ